jgi:zinc protease
LPPAASSRPPAQNAQAPAGAGRAPAPLQVPRVSVERFTLDNGLQVMVTRRPELPVVAVNTWYHVGPANEAVGRTGFAHLFEHMMFQASKHVPRIRSSAFSSLRGASDINGSTSFDFTNYYATVPANQWSWPCGSNPIAWGTCWTWWTKRPSRISRTSSATSGASDGERTVRHGGGSAVPDALSERPSVSRRRHRLAPDIQAAKLADVKQFFKEYYGPNNATVSIVATSSRKRRASLCRSTSDRSSAARP